jgi:hypothetical protein
MIVAAKLERDVVDMYIIRRGKRVPQPRAQSMPLVPFTTRADAGAE